MPGKVNARFHIPVPFSWIVLGNCDKVHEFEMEDHNNCSFTDDNSFCPAKWARRVLEAVGSGLVEVRVSVTTDAEQKVVHLIGRHVYDLPNLGESGWRNCDFLLRI